VGKVKAQISVSLDGYVAGPNQSEENPLGEGGMALHEWVFELPAFQKAHGREGGESDNPSNAVIESAQHWIGDEWRGWWGEDPPFQVPAFVLTHHPRTSPAMLTSRSAAVRPRCGRRSPPACSTRSSSTRCRSCWAAASASSTTSRPAPPSSS
jgi:hypothetical protein